MNLNLKSGIIIWYGLYVRAKGTYMVRHTWSAMSIHTTRFGITISSLAAAAYIILRWFPAPRPRVVWWFAVSLRQGTSITFCKLSNAFQPVSVHGVGVKSGSQFSEDVMVLHSLL